MSQADLKQAKNRLERVKEDLIWALAVLEDSTANLKEYTLTQDEEEEFFQECHADLAEIHTALAQAFSKKRHIKVKSRTVKMIGPIPPWLSQMESVGPVIPYQKSSQEIPFHEDQDLSIGQITPYGPKRKENE